jgi:hypothetical protein
VTGRTLDHAARQADVSEVFLAQRLQRAHAAGLTGILDRVQ